MKNLSTKFEVIERVFTDIEERIDYINSRIKDLNESDEIENKTKEEFKIKCETYENIYNLIYNNTNKL